MNNNKAAYRNEELEMRINNGPKPISKISRTHLDEAIKMAKEQDNFIVLKPLFEAYFKMLEPFI